MSYNCDRWKVKRIENLHIPFEEFFKSPRTDWAPKVEHFENSRCRISWSETIYVVGVLVDTDLSVYGIKTEGEGSGFVYNEFLVPALCKSTGELEVLTSWERGDAVEKIYVSDGKILVEDLLA